MSVFPFLVAVICVPTVLAVLSPEFQDPIHGRLIVSRRHPPLLTLKSHPERAHFIPNEAQLARIRRMVGGRRFRYKRSDNITDLLPRTRFTRNIEDFDGFVGNEENGKTADEYKSSIEAGWKKFEAISLYSGKMIIKMFKAYIDQDPMDASHLPFEVTSDKAYFKTTIVDVNELTTWLDQDLQTSLNRQAQNRPNFPVDEVLDELRECRVVDYTQVSDSDFRYDIKTDSGSMSYFKVNCIRVRENVILFFALSDTSFTPIHTTTQVSVVKSVVDRTCYLFCLISTNKHQFYTLIDTVTQKVRMTAELQRDFVKYNIDKIVQSIKIDYQSQIDDARTS